MGRMPYFVSTMAKIITVTNTYEETPHAINVDVIATIEPYKAGAKILLKIKDDATGRYIVINTREKFDDVMKMVNE